MRFLSLYKPGNDGCGKPDEQMMAAMMALIEEMTEKGVLVTTEGLQPSERGARVRHANGGYTVTDGPFTETKELIAGYAILNAENLAEAVKWTKRFLDVAGNGECEVRAIFEQNEGNCVSSEPTVSAANKG